MLTKICTKCKTEKDTAEFYRCKRGKHGVEAICKMCSSLKYQQNRELAKIQNKARYEANKEIIREKQKEYYEKNRESILIKDSLRHKKYRQENRDSILQKEAEYREKNADRLREYKSEWAQENAQRLQEKQKEYYLENREHILEKAKEWSQCNKDRVRGYKRKWKMSNPHKQIAGRKKRRKAQKIATPKWANSEFDQFYMQEIYSLARLRSDVTGILWHVDHCIPLISDVVCGLHCAANLKIITAEENLTKSNKYWEDMPCQ